MRCGVALDNAQRHAASNAIVLTFVPRAPRLRYFVDCRFGRLLVVDSDAPTANFDALSCVSIFALDTDCLVADSSPFLATATLLDSAASALAARAASLSYWTLPLLAGEAAFGVEPLPQAISSMPCRMPATFTAAATFGVVSPAP